MDKIKSVKGRETVFFYTVDGALRQKVELEIEFEATACGPFKAEAYGCGPSGTDAADKVEAADCSGSSACSPVKAEAEISAGSFGSVVSTIYLDSSRKDSYECWAPVVYPNIVDGVHKPVEAQIAIRVAGETAFVGAMILGVQRPWTIYVLADDCGDYTWGYTAEMTKKNARAHLQSQLEWIKRTAHLPSDIQNRYNINQSQEVEWFLDEMPPDKIDRLIEAIRDGHMQLSPAYNSSNTAMMLTEQLIRTLYYGRRLEKEFGFDISAAQEIESPTCTWGLAGILANAGVKFLVRNWLNYYSPYCKDRDDYGVYVWQGPDGKGVAVLSPTEACQRFSYNGARLFITKTYDKAVEELHNAWIPIFAENEAYPYDALPMAGAYGDLHSDTSGEVGALVNALHRYHCEPWDYPRIINATYNQYYDHIQRWLSTHKRKLPVLKGDFGSAWEEWPAGVAHILAAMRANVSRYLAAEAFCAMALTKSPAFRDDIDEHMQASLHCMEQIAEHPWNGSADWEKEQSNQRRVEQNHKMEVHISQMIDKAAAILYGDEGYYRNVGGGKSFGGGGGGGGVSFGGGGVRSGSDSGGGGSGGVSVGGGVNNTAVGSDAVSEGGDNGRLVSVINTLSWDTDRIVKIECDADERVFDANTSEETASYYNCGILTFLAHDIPAMGNRFFRLVKTEDHRAIGGAQCDTIENDFYIVKIDMDDGSICRIYDKQLRRELVDESAAYGLNQFAYLSHDILYEYKDADRIPGGLISDNKVFKAIVKTGWNRCVETVLGSNPRKEYLAMCEDAANQDVALSENTEYTLSNIRACIEDNGRLGATLIVKGTTYNTTVETRITLYSGIKRIDIENRVEKIPSVEPQEIHFVFPFDVPGGRLHYDSPGAILRPEEISAGGDHLPGSGRQIYSVTSFTDLSNDEYGVTLANVDSMLMQFGRRTLREYPLDPGVPGSMMLSLVMTNKQPEMRQNQAGNKDFTFRYSILPHHGPYKAIDCYRFGAELNTPALCVPVADGHFDGGSVNKHSGADEHSYAIDDTFSSGDAVSGAVNQYIALDRDDIVISAFKPAEFEPDFLLLRLRDVGGAGGRVKVRLRGGRAACEAYEADIVERSVAKADYADGAFAIDVPALGYASLKWKIEK